MQLHCFLFSTNSMQINNIQIGKGGSANLSSLRIEPTLHPHTGSMTIDHIRTCFVYGGGVKPCRQAGSGAGEYNAKSPKHGQQKVQLLRKTKDFAHLGMLFIYEKQLPLVKQKRILYSVYTANNFTAVTKILVRTLILCGLQQQHTKNGCHYTVIYLHIQLLIILFRP